MSRGNILDILDINVNYRQQRLFLEALHSIQDINAVNEHVHFPKVYLTLETSLGTGDVKSLLWMKWNDLTLTKATESFWKFSFMRFLTSFKPFFKIS